MTTAIAILQKLKSEVEQLLAQLNSSASRLYEISTTGNIVERTMQVRERGQNLIEQLQQAIDLLRQN
jgi:HPt (histidine-containing phosphotransfer) domain-containing protein